jgi:hypothetical protein
VTHEDASASLHRLGLMHGAVASFPQVRQVGAGVVHGPRARFPLPADRALVWAEPAQAMLLGEALHTTAWSASGRHRATLTGRAACGASALALLVIPGEAIPTLAYRLSRIVASNEAMLEHDRAKKSAPS